MRRRRRRLDGARVRRLVGCARAQQNGCTVSPIAVVPAPASVTADAAAAPFPLTAGVHVAGDPVAAEAFAAAVVARTGIRPGLAEDGPVVFRIAPGGAPESYRLEADAASVAVTAPDAAGLFYGAQTLAQLIAVDGDRCTIPAVTIDDAPRFGYRGLMLDVARHFFDVATVKSVIDRASALKLNALHLHLSDDHGWRLQLDSRPELAELASDTAVGGDAGGYYTKADYAELVAYAAARHMIVVPEIDLPGHTHAIGLAYPQLAADPVITAHIEEVVREYGGEPPRRGEPYTGFAVGFSSLRIHEEATYDFVADVFGELAAMTPGPYLHLGGDETLGTSAEDFAEFMARASAIIADLGKTPVAWHEAGAAPGLDDHTIGQYWGFVVPDGVTDVAARAIVAKGSRLILSPADAVYLDMKNAADGPLGLTWARGHTSVSRSYDWEPTAIIDGVGERDILGVEAALWTETIRTLADIDDMVFPRLASAAEVAWSPAPGASDLRTWESFRERVGALGPLWRAQGIGYHADPEVPWVS